MKIIGLTGGIGSGKSTVLQLFKEFGVETFVADIEAKKLMSTDKELIEQIKELVGNQAYTDNELNRIYISSIIFNNKEKLEALNALVHPKVKECFNKFVKKSKADFVIYEAAILFESGSYKFCDFIITVTADFNAKIKRIMERDSVSKQQILERMKHQLNDDFKIKNANFVIRNINLKDTKTQVSTVFDLICKLCYK